MPRPHPNEPTNTGAGPSNHAPPHVSYEATPPTNPSRGTIEITADAEIAGDVTEDVTGEVAEEDAAEEDFAEEYVDPVGNVYVFHVLRVVECFSDVSPPYTP